MGENKDRSLGRWLSILYRYGHCYLDKELNQYNLRSGQAIFLAILLEKDGMSQESLSSLLQIDKATTARAIKKLEQEGYVVRKPSPRDRRAKIIYVTEKALAIKPVLIIVGEKWTDILTNNFNPEEKELIIELLKKMAQNAAQYVKSN